MISSAEQPLGAYVWIWLPERTEPVSESAVAAPGPR